MTDPHSIFRFNVGFIVAESAGYSREFPLQTDKAILQELELHNLSGTVTFARTPQGLLLQSRLTATVAAECTRCLEPIELEVHPVFSELYAFKKNAAVDAELIVPETVQIDISPLVREYMILEMPIKPLCKIDCKGLCPVCGENQNLVTCHHEDDPVDPRFALLKTLLKEDQNPTDG